MTNTLTEQLKKYSADLDKEAKERAAIKESEEYTTLEKQKAEIEEKQKQMLSTVCDSSEAYEDAKEELLEHFKKNDIDYLDGVSAKYRKSKVVNPSKVLEALGGDLDAFILNAKITQVQLKDFAKANPEYKKGLLDCIEEGEIKIVDLEIANE